MGRKGCESNLTRMQGQSAANENSVDSNSYITFVRYSENRYVTRYVWLWSKTRGLLLSQAPSLQDHIFYVQEKHAGAAKLIYIQGVIFFTFDA
jgi:hypothetical protein